MSTYRIPKLGDIYIAYRYYNNTIIEIIMKTANNNSFNFCIIIKL